jgi:hypothetical protein
VSWEIVYARQAAKMLRFGYTDAKSKSEASLLESLRSRSSVSLLVGRRGRRKRSRSLPRDKSRDSIKVVTKNRREVDRYAASRFFS